MKKIIFKLIVVTLMVSLLVTPFTYAETIINEAALSTTIETEDLSTDFLEEGEIAPMSLACAGLSGGQYQFLRSAQPLHRTFAGNRSSQYRYLGRRKGVL